MKYISLLMLILGMITSCTTLNIDELDEYNGVWAVSVVARTDIGNNNVKCVGGQGNIQINQGRIEGTVASEYNNSYQITGSIDIAGRVDAGLGIFEGQSTSFTGDLDRNVGSGYWYGFADCKGTWTSQRVGYQPDNALEHGLHIVTNHMCHDEDYLSCLETDTATCERAYKSDKVASCLTEESSTKNQLEFTRCLYASHVYAMEREATKVAQCMSHKKSVRWGIQYPSQ